MNQKNTLQTRTFITALVAFIFNSAQIFGVNIDPKLVEFINYVLGLAFSYFLRDAVNKNETAINKVAEVKSQIVPVVEMLELGDADHLNRGI